ncbi:MAG: hypothetical protein JF615_17490 [Asticcacaulis sp.]|nr:hypothetical protein [Asticcacaulis sp.]
MHKLPTRRLVLALAPLLAASPVLAAEGGDKAAGEPSVRLASVGIPVMRDRQVVNYLFLTIRINLTMTAPEGKFRAMEPLFRDALIRLSHRVSFGREDRSDQLDEARFKTAVTAEFVKITGPGMIKSVDVLSQSPKHHLD